MNAVNLNIGGTSTSFKPPYSLNGLRSTSNGLNLKTMDIVKRIPTASLLVSAPLYYCLPEAQITSDFAQCGHH